MGVEELLERIKTIQDEAHELMGKHTEEYKAKVNQHRKQHALEVGDWVMVQLRK